MVSAFCHFALRIKCNTLVRIKQMYCQNIKCVIVQIYYQYATPALPLNLTKQQCIEKSDIQEVHGTNGSICLTILVYLSRNVNPYPAIQSRAAVQMMPPILNLFLPAKSSRIVNSDKILKLNLCNWFSIMSM